jgi:hypothetical protein
MSPKNGVTVVCVVVMILISMGFVFVPQDTSVEAQDTQIPMGWVKFNHHSHGMFDVHDENGTIVGTIDESQITFMGSTGDTPAMIRDEFGENGVFIHSPHVNNFEPYKEHWHAQMVWENEQWTTTTNFTLGEEYHIDGRHVGLINNTYFMAYDDYTNFKDFRDNISSQGALMIINHPSHTWTADPPYYLQPGYDFDGLEIYNNRVEFVGGPLALAETDGRAHYRNAVAQGRLLAVLGGSDAHNTVGGWQTYTVAEDPAGERDLDAVVRAIKKRRTYAAAYDMSVYDRSFYLECAEMGQVIESRDITFNVSPPSANTYTVDLFRDNNTSPIQTWSTSGDDTFTYTIPASDANENAAYTIEIYEGGSASSSSAIAYSTAIWYQPGIDYNISLKKGWNLISIPLGMDNTSITEVLSTITGDYNVVQWYDPVANAWKTFPGDDFEINNKISFWIHMKYDSILRNTGKLPFYTTIPLYASSKNGWNLLGFPAESSQSISNALYYLGFKFTAVQSFDALDNTDPWKHHHRDKQNNDLGVFDPGSGYWIRVNEDCELVVFN